MKNIHDNTMTRYKSVKDLNINVNNTKRGSSSNSVLNACIGLGSPFDEVGRSMLCG